eukprot:gb/GEZN01003613.1/.p1 GENE.gb/GEZN01003613.1/~~gb/GEZN01003613.1/.p1  ORF type:complete len:661 (-),score=49.11 gb/GEZN01003613.1/:152-2110(-)
MPEMQPMESESEDQGFHYLMPHSYSPPWFHLFVTSSLVVLVAIGAVTLGRVYALPTKTITQASPDSATRHTQTLEPNPPEWPHNVYVFDDQNQAYAQTIVNSIFQENGGMEPPDNGQFSSSRYALLFKPGVYDSITVPVGYYTQVLGLGESPRDVSIKEIHCESGNPWQNISALNNFWRSAENLYTKPTKVWPGLAAPAMMWAASQSCPLRKIVIEGNLVLWQLLNNSQGIPDAGYASGGFLGSSEVLGTISFGSQQQYLVRNSLFDPSLQPFSAWNTVLLGTQGINGLQVPDTRCGELTTVEKTPIIAEKPFISIDPKGRYQLNIPPLEFDLAGLSSRKPSQVDFSYVYVATEKDSAAKINSKLSQGFHLVLSAGNYYLDDSIFVSRPNTVVLGIGFPTLIAEKGRPAMVVGDVDGVRLAGPVLFQAGPISTLALLQWGYGGYPGNKQNSSFMYDIFARVGGSTSSSKKSMTVDYMVLVSSGHVVIDNSWLWRADHDVAGPVRDARNPVLSGLVVHGNDVTSYGLKSEHTLEDLVYWTGDRGRNFFYQSELPYDVNQSQWRDHGGYRIVDSVTSHECWGCGVYCYFRDFVVKAKTGIVAPNKPDIFFINVLTHFLDGLKDSGIAHVINNAGAPVGPLPTGGGNTSYVCKYV